MSILGAIGGAVGSSALNIFGDWATNQLVTRPQADRAFHQSLEAMDKQFELESQASATAYERSLESYGKRYQMTAEDMKKAGINPIMAASGGFQVGQGVTAPKANVSSAQAFLPHSTIGSTSQGVRNIAEASKLFEETKKTVEETKEVISRVKVNSKRADLLFEEAVKNRIEQNVLTQQEEVLVNQIKNLKKDFFIKAEQLNKLRTEVIINKDMRYQISAKTQKLLLEGRELKNKLIILSKVANVYDSPAGQTLAAVKEVLGALNLNLGLIGGFKK